MAFQGELKTNSTFLIAPDWRGEEARKDLFGLFMDHIKTVKTKTVVERPAEERNLEREGKGRKRESGGLWI